MDIDRALQIIDENLDFDLYPLYDDVNNLGSHCPEIKAVDIKYSELENRVGDHIPDSDRKGDELLIELSDAIDDRMAVWNGFQFACGVMVGLRLAGLSVDAVKGLANRINFGTLRLGEWGDR